MTEYEQRKADAEQGIVWCQHCGEKYQPRITGSFCPRCRDRWRDAERQLAWQIWAEALAALHAAQKLGLKPKQRHEVLRASIIVSGLVTLFDAEAKRLSEQESK
jgi:uncharacterized paraquat-inducible protein A